MTVRKLNAAQKAAVVTIYTSNIRPSSIKHLAEVLCVSTRTIGRVIKEAGFVSSKLLTQTERSKKSPSGHNGKQALLSMNFPTSLELH